ncbi:MAG: O-antigen ligase family protein [Candidatus Aureabacteria bacterium]|nr:O-antigen ligase family protein [Candidatus Auribacterota bacterium]
MNDKTKEVSVPDYILVAILIAVSVFAPAALGAMRPWSGAFLRMLGAALFVLFGLSVFRKGEILFNRLDLTALLFLFYCLIWLCFAPVKYFAAGEFLNVLNYFFLFFVSERLLAGKKTANIYFIGLLLSVLFVSSYGLIDYFKGTDSVFGILRPVQYHGRLGGTYVCPNHCSGFFEITFFLFLSCLFTRKINTGYKIIIGYILALVVLSLFLCKSRGGLAGMLIGIITFSVFVVRERKKNFLLGLSIILIVVIIMSIAFSPLIIQRFSNLSSDTSVNTRITIWKDTLRLIKQKPLLGFGLGSYKWVYPAVRSIGMSRDINFAHNDYLHTWAELGIFGLALVLWFIFSYLMTCIKSIGGISSLTKRFILYGIISGIAVILVHSLTDFNMHILANASILIIMAGMGSGIVFSSFGPGKMPGLKIKSAWALIVFSSAGIVACVFSLMDIRAAALEIKASRAVEAGEFDAAIAYYERSMSNYRVNPEIYKDAGRIYEILYKFRKDNGFREKAVDMFQKGAEANPLEGDFNLGLGLIYQSEKKFADAQSEFLKALGKDPNNAYYNNVIGTYYYIIGDNEKAEKYFRDSSRMDFCND